MPLIAVTGSATRHYPAERAAVKVVISLEGKDRATVVEQASALHATVSTEARRQVEIGAATWWGADRVYASTHERYLKDSDVKVPYEVARANLTIRFQNFEKLADFVTNTAKLTGVSIGSIDWQLTESTKFTAEKAARMDAVRNALRNAADYAGALGFPAPTLVAIFEPGLRPNSQIVGGAGTFSARSGGGQSSSSAAIALKPSDIEVSATITADFETTASA